MLIARSHLTRVLHLAVLLTVVEQLLTSQFMERPLAGEDPDWPFALHEQVGLVGLGVLMLFWLWTLMRDERETPLQRLFPWFSNEPLSEVVADVRTIVRAVARFRAPPLHLDALSSAVHGLGLLLATFLAMSGALWFALFTGTPYGRIVLMLFWLWTLMRDERETPLQRLFPWFSKEALADVVADIEAIVRAAARFRAPPLHLDALSSAVHGLGLLLATFLAMSGALWFALFTGTAYGRIVLSLHALAGNLMWAYLTVHAVAALLHQARGDRIFARMFWVRRRRHTHTAPAE